MRLLQHLLLNHFPYSDQAIVDTNWLNSSFLLLSNQSRCRYLHTWLFLKLRNSILTKCWAFFIGWPFAFFHSLTVWNSLFNEYSLPLIWKTILSIEVIYRRRYYIYGSPIKSRNKIITVDNNSGNENYRYVISFCFRTTITKYRHQFERGS